MGFMTNGTSQLLMNMENQSLLLLIKLGWQASENEAKKFIITQAKKALLFKDLNSLGKYYGNERPRRISPYCNRLPYYYVDLF